MAYVNTSLRFMGNSLQYLLEYLSKTERHSASKNASNQNIIEIDSTR